jgi:hypothetical protein
LNPFSLFRALKARQLLKFPGGLFKKAGGLLLKRLRSFHQKASGFSSKGFDLFPKRLRAFQNVLF